MKKIFLLLLIFAGLLGKAQKPNNYYSDGSRRTIVALKVDSGFTIQGYAGIPYLRTGTWNGAGHLGVDTVNHRFYFLSGGSQRRVANYDELSSSLSDSSIWKTTGNNTSISSSEPKFGTTSNDPINVITNNQVTAIFPAYGIKRNDTGSYLRTLVIDSVTKKIGWRNYLTGGGGGGNQTLDQTLGYGNQSAKELVLGDQDSLGSRFNYDWKTSTFGTWIKIGSTTTATGSVSGTTFSGGSSWSDYIQANPYYLSAENWTMTTGKFVFVTAADSCKGFAIGMNGSPAALLAYFHLADSTGYISFHYQTSQNPVMATNKGLEKFNRNAGDTGQVWLIRRGQNVTAAIKNYRTGQVMSLGIKYKLSYPTPFVAPKSGMPHMFFFGGSYKFLDRFDFRADENKRPKVLFMTTSIGAGLNANDQLGSYPYVAMQGINGNFSVHGMPGESMNGSLIAIDENRSYFKAGHVVIEMTTNSLNGATPATSFAHDLDSFCRRMADSSIGVSIVNCIPQLTNGTTYNDSINAIAGRYNAVVYDAFNLLKRAGGTSMDAKYTYDSIHLNPLGHQMLGRLIREKMIQNGIIDTVSVAKVIGLPFDNTARYVMGIGEGGRIVAMSPPANLGNTDMTSPDDRVFNIPDKQFAIAGFTGMLFKSASSGVFADPGAGSMMFFNAPKRAFRAGYYTGSFNPQDSIGLYTGGGGYNTTLPGTGGFGWGQNMADRGNWNFGGGSGNTLTSSANYNLYSGINNFIVGPGNVVGGNGNKADTYGLNVGLNNETLNGYDGAIGHDIKANGNTTIGAGSYLTMVGNGSIGLGHYYNDNGGFQSMFLGDVSNDLITAAAHKTLYMRFLNGLTFFLNSSTVALNINSSGIVKMPAYGAGTATFDASGNISSVSDVRLKNVKSRYQVGLGAIMKIKPITFKWKPESGMETDHLYNGFSAQNIEEALGKDAIGVNSKGYKSIQDRNILAALVNAIQQQQAQIEALKRTIKKLKSK